MDRVTIYKTPNGKYAWRRRADNGHMLSESTMIFDRRADCALNALANNLGAWELYFKHDDGTVTPYDDRS